MSDDWVIFQVEIGEVVYLLGKIEHLAGLLAGRGIAVSPTQEGGLGERAGGR